MSDAYGATQRLADSDRQAVIAALTAHREAGRLDSTEYEERQVAASQAKTWGDIGPLFTDLPEPHPVQLSPAIVAAAAPGGGAVDPARTSSVVPDHIVPERFRNTVMALTPFAALVLFFITKQWMWFLAIPVMGILLFGSEGRHDRDRRRDRRWHR